eukprot:6469340-Amphidinium_carterae.1
MPGPWYKPRDDPEFLGHYEIHVGTLVEIAVYDSESAGQGTVLVKVVKSFAAARHGKVFEATFLVCSDPYYAYWMSSGGFPLHGCYHLCAGCATACRYRPNGRGAVVHTDRIRTVLPEDVEKRVLAWMTEEQVEHVLESIGHKRFEDQPQGGGGLQDLLDVEGCREQYEGEAGVQARLAGLERELAEDEQEHPKRQKDVNPLTAKELVGVVGLEPVKDMAVVNRKERKRRSRSRSRHRRRNSEDDTGSERDFQMAPQSTNRQAALMRFAEKFPGRLATRLMQKMYQETNRGGGADSQQGQVVHPCAHAYYLMVLVPQHRARLTIRTQRELRTWSIVLDLLVKHQIGAAADIAAQRLKALEKSAVDGHWDAAELLELVPPEQATLLEKAENRALQKELMLDRKYSHQNWKGKGDSKGKEWEKGVGKKGFGKKGGKERSRSNRRNRGRNEPIEVVIPDAKVWKIWRLEVQLWLSRRPCVADMGRMLIRYFVSTPGLLRHLAEKLMEHAQPLSEGKAFALDLLPVHLESVRTHVMELGFAGEVVEWCIAVFFALNALFCNAWRDQGPVCLQHPAGLTPPQLVMVKRIAGRVEQWLTSVGTLEYPGGHQFEQATSAL